MPKRKPVIGLALGSGSARGWAHVGVLRTLLEAGIRPDIVCGSSVGAIVGAAYATGKLDSFEEWIRSLRMRDVISLMDFRLTGGMLKGEKLVSFFRKHFEDCRIEDLPMPFGAVATALHGGNELWLREGSLVDAVRASIALPGVFTPVMVQERLLVDGGLVNPVPVTLARAMGADIVIAVDLNRDILQRHLQPPDEPAQRSPWLQSIQNTLGGWLPDSVTDIVSSPLPSMLEVLATSINIMQERITRSRMAGDPPDMVIAPRLAHLSLMDFHRAQEAIDVGRQATEFLLPVMQPWVNVSPPDPAPILPAPLPGASDVLADVPPPVVDAS